ncbi:uncharacterized protein K452DRAFT_291936, partial [Aplosporella prunicola CBS 121167]
MLSLLRAFLWLPIFILSALSGASVANPYLNNPASPDWEPCDCHPNIIFPISALSRQQLDCHLAL